MKKNFEMNMCEGSILKKLVIFTLPLLGANLLQLLFNTADVAVLGIFIPDKVKADAAVAAVGSTGHLIQLITGLFVGLSVGANVIVARCIGENNMEKSRRVVGTSVTISLIVGVFLALVGWFGARTFLTWMKCDSAVLDMATTYLKIYFLGMPIMMLYNFSSAILRAVGDTLRPLIFLSIGGAVNVILNIFFTAVVGFDVEGVAIATVVSQLIAAVLTVITLMKTDGYGKFEPRKIKILFTDIIEIVKIGVPAGITGCMFSIANVLMQSSINSFGKDAMTANSVASQIEGIVYYFMYSIAVASLSFVSQNYGAGRIDRVRKTVRISLALAGGAGILTGGFVILFSNQLCSIITKNTEIIQMARERLIIVVSLYFLCGLMDVFSNAIQGLGKSALAMIITLSGSCIFRVIWLATAFRFFPQLSCIYVIYPISWSITTLTYIAFYIPMIKKIEKKF